MLTRRRQPSIVFTTCRPLVCAIVVTRAPHVNHIITHHVRTCRHNQCHRYVRRSHSPGHHRTHEHNDATVAATSAVVMVVVVAVLSTAAHTHATCRHTQHDHLAHVAAFLLLLLRGAEAPTLITAKTMPVYVLCVAAGRPRASACLHTQPRSSAHTYTCWQRC